AVPAQPLFRQPSGGVVPVFTVATADHLPRLLLLADEMSCSAASTERIFRSASYSNRSSGNALPPGITRIIRS
ncbi:hypothetical protein SIL08_05710, partial [Scandinavium sp. V105_16]|nr:hypothetical protein [Scandinavium sp. V105_16]